MGPGGDKPRTGPMLQASPARLPATLLHFRFHLTHPHPLLPAPLQRGAERVVEAAPQSADDHAPRAAGPPRLIEALRGTGVTVTEGHGIPASLTPSSRDRCHTPSSICNSWRPSEARSQHLPDVGRALEHRPPSRPVGRSPAHPLGRTERMGHAWRLAVRVRGRCASPACPNPVSQARANSGSLPSQRHRWRRRRQCGSGVR
jgi:hypothetical protein